MNEWIKRSIEIVNNGHRKVFRQIVHANGLDIDSASRLIGVSPHWLKTHLAKSGVFFEEDELREIAGLCKFSPDQIQMLMDAYYADMVNLRRVYARSKGP